MFLGLQYAINQILDHFFDWAIRWRVKVSQRSMMDLLDHVDLANYTCRFFDLSSIQAVLVCSRQMRCMLIQIFTELKESILACYPCEVMQRWISYHQTPIKAVQVRYNIRWDGYVVRNMPLKQHMLYAEIVHSAATKIQFEPFRHLPHGQVSDDSSSSEDDVSFGYWVSYDTSGRFALMFHGHSISTPSVRKNRANFKIFTRDGVFRLIDATFSNELDMEYNNLCTKIEQNPMQRLTRMTLDTKCFGQCSILCVADSHLKYLQSEGTKFQLNHERRPIFIWDQTHKITIGRELNRLRDHSSLGA